MASTVETTRQHLMVSNPVHQAYWILRFGFTVAPIIMGLDKFFQVLTEWPKYLAPTIPQLLRLEPHTFMRIVGGIEIIAGIIVAIKPRIGGYLVAAWLLGIIVNLLMVGGYLDIALRDLGLLLGALALARLAEAENSARS
jgi:hypothetical protein